MDEILKLELTKYLFKNKILVSLNESERIFNFILQDLDGSITCCSYNKYSLIKLLLRGSKSLNNKEK